MALSHSVPLIRLKTYFKMNFTEKMKVSLSNYWCYYTFNI